MYFCQNSPKMPESRLYAEIKKRFFCFPHGLQIYELFPNPLSGYSRIESQFSRKTGENIENEMSLLESLMTEIPWQIWGKDSCNKRGSTTLQLPCFAP